jgi:hypothetical protein
MKFYAQEVDWSLPFAQTSGEKMAKKRNGHYSNGNGSRKISDQSRVTQLGKINRKFHQRQEVMRANREWRQDQERRAKLAEAAD